MKINAILVYRATRLNTNPLLVRTSCVYAPPPPPPAARNNLCPQFQATFANTVSEVEALKKTVSTLQRGRAENSSSSGGSRDWKAGRDGAEICARCDRSLERAGGGRNGQNREAQAPQASTNPTAAPARRAFDNPSDYHPGYSHPSSHSRAACRSYEEASLERGVSAMDDDDAANSGPP